MLEPVQGEGGVNVPSADYLREVRTWCDENNLVMILDEVQTGIGRLGTLFGYEQSGVEPDVITLAKGLGGGVPIGAFLSKEKYSVLAPGDHGSTYGGNPLACAAAYAVVRHVVENNLIGNVIKTGNKLKSGLQKFIDKYEIINEIRGTGLLLAMEFKSDISAQLVSLSNEEGLLLNPVRPNAIRFMPPLNISDEEIDIGLNRLEQALSKLVSN